MKNIRRKAFDIKSVRLSPEEGFVLSRLDSPLSTRELVSLTGLDEGRIVEIVEGLATQGVIDLESGRWSGAPAAAAAPGGRGARSCGRGGAGGCRRGEGRARAVRRRAG